MTEEKRAYHRQYNIARHHRVMSEAKEKLGGKCVQCGSVDDLQFDHIDRSTKSFNISQWINRSKAALEAELKKCQLLCHDCHSRKTTEELGKRVAKGTHGTLSSYRYCRCDACKRAFHDYMQAWKARRASLAA